MDTLVIPPRALAAADGSTLQSLACSVSLSECSLRSAGSRWRFHIRQSWRASRTRRALRRGWEQPWARGPMPTAAAMIAAAAAAKESAQVHVPSAHVGIQET